MRVASPSCAAVFRRAPCRGRRQVATL